MSEVKIAQDEHLQTWSLRSKPGLVAKLNFWTDSIWHNSVHYLVMKSIYSVLLL